MSLKKLREQLAAGEVAFQERVREGIPLYAGPMVIRRADCDAMAWAADEIERLRSIVCDLAACPFPLHDHVTTETWEAACLLAKAAEAGKDGA